MIDKDEAIYRKILEDLVECPICGYSIDKCQCRYAGSAHPDRDKRAEVVMEHLYLFNKQQVQHILELQKYWHISYVDDDKSTILKELEYKYGR